MTTRPRAGESLMDARRRLERRGRQAGQVLAADAQHVERGADAGDRGAQIGLPDSPFLTMHEGARFARFDDCQEPARAFRQWLGRKAVPVVRARGALLVERRVLELVLKG